jgi:hypothetical protein
MTLEEQLVAEVIELGDGSYKDVHMLEDGTIICTHDLAFTRSLIVDLDRWGWGHRYCYEDRALATKACAALKTGDDKPLEGYIAERYGTRRLNGREK